MALSLGGAVAPAATPLAADASNPNFRRFALTAVDADTGPTTFNHGVSVPAGQVPLLLVTLTSASATTVVTGNISVIPTVANPTTQIDIAKNNLAGSGTGIAQLAIITVWNIHTGIK